MAAGQEPSDETAYDELVWALGKEMMRLTRRRVLVPEGCELDQSAFRILWVLSEFGPLSMSALGEVLQLEQSTISRQVSAAVRQGLVDNQVIPGTKRRQVNATAAGLDAYRRDSALRNTMFRHALRQLGVRRARDLALELRDLNDAMDRAHSPESGLETGPEV